MEELLGMLLIAAGDGGHDAHWNYFEMISTLVNFIVFAGFLGWILRKPLNNFLKTRREEMAKQLEEAKSKQQAAETRLSEYQEKLDNLEREVQAVVKSHEAQGEADRARLSEEADKAIERLVREINFTIRQESLKAQKEIKAASVEATIRVAESLVKERITDADQRRLADEYIGQLES